MLVSPTLSLPAAMISMLLPVHAPFEGFVIATVGGVVSPVPVPFDTVMLTDAVAVLPAASVAVKVSVCVPFAVVVVSHVGDAVLPLTLWLYSVVPLSSFSTNCVGAAALLTARLTPLLVPLTVAPLSGQL